MGGMDASRLGNAGARTLVVNCRMGGVSADLSGELLRDCDAQLSVSMGGLAVMVPAGVEVREGLDEDTPLLAPPGEMAPPVLRVRKKTGLFSEIEIVER